MGQKAFVNKLSNCLNALLIIPFPFLFIGFYLPDPISLYHLPHSFPSFLINLFKTFLQDLMVAISQATTQEHLQMAFLLQNIRKHPLVTPSQQEVAKKRTFTHLDIPPLEPGKIQVRKEYCLFEKAHPPSQRDLVSSYSGCTHSLEDTSASHKPTFSPAHPLKSLPQKPGHKKPLSL